MYSHIFDCIAKVSAWRINGQQVQFVTKFIQSKFYRTSLRKNGFEPIFSVGPVLSISKNQTKSGPFDTIRAIYNSRDFDNNVVNIWDLDPARRGVTNRTVLALTDTPGRSTLLLDDLSTVSTYGVGNLEVPGFKALFGLMPAHPTYSQRSDDTYNLAIFVTQQGQYMVALLKESPDGKRATVGYASYHYSGFAYTHSFGLSKNYAVIILNPFRLQTKDMVQVSKKGFMRAMTDINQTEIIVFSLDDGSVVMQELLNEKLFFYHTISSVENQNTHGETEISVRLLAYKTSDFIKGEHQFMRLEQALTGKAARNLIPQQGKICDVLLNLNSASVQIAWKELPVNQGFEYPTTRYSRSFGEAAATALVRHPRYVYAMGSHVGGEFDNFGLFKVDTESNFISAVFHRDSAYVTEPTFVPDPNGTDEDDGVILSPAYDGSKRETGLLVLNAKTMELVAQVWTGQRSPYEYHGAWVPLVHS